MKIALLMLIFLATASPVLADDPQITCATVRAYVSQDRFHAGQGAGSCRRADSGATTEKQGSALRTRTDLAKKSQPYETAGRECLGFEIVSTEAIR